MGGQSDVSEYRSGLGVQWDAQQPSVAVAIISTPVLFTSTSAIPQGLGDTAQQSTPGPSKADGRLAPSQGSSSDESFWDDWTTLGEDHGSSSDAEDGGQNQPRMSDPTEQSDSSPHHALAPYSMLHPTALQGTPSIHNLDTGLNPSFLGVAGAFAMRGSSALLNPSSPTDHSSHLKDQSLTPAQPHLGNNDVPIQDVKPKPMQLDVKPASNTIAVFIYWSMRHSKFAFHAVQKDTVNPRTAATYVQPFVEELPMLIVYRTWGMGDIQTLDGFLKDRIELLNDEFNARNSVGLSVLTDKFFQLYTPQADVTGPKDLRPKLTEKSMQQFTDALTAKLQTEMDKGNSSI
ncbi:hypothetical protein H4R34_005324 [Dimargaris verticillata]|uniref:Uncharacterized protein n=1 Tax=Dimargaris verticillata TaxID=2761393 RepID=A0A9W8EAC8_9FUNG|nr:hypothetical protein H4R34_005324 [Dimargaris verticillata]